MRLEDYFRGLSDPTRLRIMNLLFHNKLCGCDLQELLSIPQPLVSRHLVYLKRSGLVVDRRDGFRVFYHPAEGKRLDQLFEFLRSAFRGEDVFGLDAKRLHQVLEEGLLPSRRVKLKGPDRVQRRAGHKRMHGLEASRGRRTAP
jgi:ArsR family transcriptional regulator, arsenate/arsenite/antimonite-responsive transcriptional repressor